MCVLIQYQSICMCLGPVISYPFTKMLESLMWIGSNHSHHSQVIGKFFSSF